MITNEGARAIAAWRMADNAAQARYGASRGRSSGGSGWLARDGCFLGGGRRSRYRTVSPMGRSAAMARRPTGEQFWDTPCQGHKFRIYTEMSKSSC
jgi:hypothetical protein